MRRVQDRKWFGLEESLDSGAGIDYRSREVWRLGLSVFYAVARKQFSAWMDRRVIVMPCVLLPLRLIYDSSTVSPASVVLSLLLLLVVTISCAGVDYYYYYYYYY